MAGWYNASMTKQKQNRITIVIIVLLALLLCVVWGTRLYDASQPYGTYVAHVATSTTVTLELKKDSAHTAILTKKTGVKIETKSGSWERTPEKEIVVTLPDDKLVLKIEDKQIKVVDGGDTLPPGTVFDQQPPSDQDGGTATSTDRDTGKGSTDKGGNTDINPGITIGEPDPNGGGVTQPPIIPPQEALVLDGTAWQLVSYNGKTVEKGASYPLTFEKGMMSQRFCNAPGGEYTLKGNTVTATLMSTQMACEDPLLMEMESVFGAMFDKGATVTIKDGMLTFDNGRGVTFSYSQLKK